jgi:hypothetical protein
VCRCVEEVGEINLYNPPGPAVDVLADALQRLVRRPLRSEPERAGQEAGLEDRLQDQPGRGLRYPVPHPRDSEWAALLRPSRLGDVDPAHRLRAVAPVQQVLAQLRQHPLHPVGFHRLQGLTVDAGGALVATDLLPGPPQHVWPSDPVVQGVEAPLTVPLRGHVERSLECTDFVDGVVGRSHALTRPSQLARHRSAGPFLRRVVLSRRSSVLFPAPTASAPSWTSGSPYTRTCFRGYRPRSRAREALPS